MRSRIVPLMVIASLLGACGGGAEEAEMAEPDTAGMAEAPEAAPEMGMAEETPDTTADAVWAHIQEADYESWALWPEKGELYEGTEPHGMLLTTYVNALAEDALTNGAAEMPDGAIVIKDNYAPDSTLAATTVMYKAEGYAPDRGDWFWAKYGADGSVQAAGHVESCESCHSQADDYDKLMTLMAQRGDSGGS